MAPCGAGNPCKFNAPGQCHVCSFENCFILTNGQQQPRGLFSYFSPRLPVSLHLSQCLGWSYPSFADTLYCPVCQRSMCPSGVRGKPGTGEDAWMSSEGSVWAWMRNVPGKDLCIVNTSLNLLTVCVLHDIPCQAAYTIIFLVWFVLAAVYGLGLRQSGKQ